MGGQAVGGGAEAAGAPHGGVPSAGQPSGGSSLGGGGSGGYAGLPFGGYPPVTCVDGIVDCDPAFGCLCRCVFEGIGPYGAGDYFYPWQYPDPRECSQCVCQVDGTVICDDAKCPTDCEYLEAQYQGAFYQAQNCVMNAEPDPCGRILSEDLDCYCPAPVASKTSYFDLSSSRGQDWLDQGCKKPNTACPPCPPVGNGVPYCDQEEFICRYH